MERQTVVNWLNYRLQLTIQQRANVIQDTDVQFIREYIHHYKDKLVPTESVIQSINNNLNTVMNKIEFMINKLIEDFDIKTETKDIGMSINFGGIMPEGKLITKYF